MPLFDKQPAIPRPRFKDILKKAKINEGTGQQLSPRQKETLGDMEFPKKFGSDISKTEYDTTIRRLKSEKMSERDFSTKFKLGKEIKFLEELEKKGDSSTKPGI